MAGQKNAGNLLIDPPDAPKKIDAVIPGHLDIAEHQMDLLGVQNFQRTFRTIGRPDLSVDAAGLPVNAIHHSFYRNHFIIHNQ